MVMLLCNCGSSRKNVSDPQFSPGISDIKDAKIGIVGCKMVNSYFSSLISQEETEAHLAQCLINWIRTKSDFNVFDRTKLKVVLEEYALSLAGIIQNPDVQPEIDIQSTDFLLMAVITGFNAQIKEISGDEDMSEVSFMFQGKVSYHLSLEMLDSQTGSVRWTYSKKVVNAEYDLDKDSINLKDLIFRTLTENIDMAIDSLCNH